MIMARNGRHGRVDKQSSGFTFELECWPAFRTVQITNLFYDVAIRPELAKIMKSARTGRDHEGRTQAHLGVLSLNPVASAGQGGLNTTHGRPSGLVRRAVRCG